MALVTPLKVAAGVTSAVEAADKAESIVHTFRSGYDKLKAVKKTTVSAYQRYRNRNKPRARTPTRKDYRSRSTGNFPSYKSDRAYNLKVERAYDMAYRKGYLPRPRNYRRKYVKRGSTLTKSAVRTIARKEVNKVQEVKRNPFYRTSDGVSSDLATGLHSGEPLVWNLGNSISRGTQHFARTGSHIRYLGFNFRLFVENKLPDAKLGVRLMLLKLKYPGAAVKDKLFEDNDNAGDEIADDMEGGNVTATSTHLNKLHQLYRPINKDRFELKFNTVFFCDRASKVGDTSTNTRVANRFYHHFFKINQDFTYDDDEVVPTYKLVMMYQYITSEPIPSATKPFVQVGQFDEFFTDG